MNHRQAVVAIPHEHIIAMMVGAFIGHAFFMTQEAEIELEKAVHVGMSLMLIDQTGTFDGGGAIVVPIERAIGINGLGININGYQ